jgi:hypothetical protein
MMLLKTTVALLCLATRAVSLSQEIALAYKPARIDNPLKGLIPSNYGLIRKTFPHSLRYINLSLADLVPDENHYDWNSLDRPLHAISNDGKQAVIRIYLDWPGRTNTVPPFLQHATQLIDTPGWRSGERFPNYDSPPVRTTLRNFVTAFGERYDGNSDIGFIEAGLLGAWGEWLSAGKAAPAPSPEVQREILDAYEAAFHTTKILIRYPTLDTVTRPFGYHDDWFGRKDQMASRFAALALPNQSLWKTVPFGGRIHPEIQKCLSRPSKPCQLTAEHYNELQSGHFTYLRLDSQNAIQPGLGWDNGLKFAQILGYEFYISSAKITFDKANATLTTTLQIKNTGIAPFYYPWLFEFALAENGTIKQKWTADWDIRKVLPGAAETRFVQSQISVPPGNYRLLVRIHNLARKDLFISFANENQDADLQGWLTLGSASL